MKRFVMTVALVCALALTAVAGQVPTGGAPEQPPPAGITQSTGTTSPGEVPTGGYAEQVSEAALSGFLAVLSLLVV
jgi:hypothetical protein